MKRSQKLKPVEQFVENQEKEAAKKLGEISQKLINQKHQLAQLEMYREQYARGFNDAGAQYGFTGSQAQDFQSFMENLKSAIEQQRNAIDAMEQDFEFKKRQWLAARNRHRAIGNVIQKHEHTEQRQEEKREQRDIDDRAGSLSRSKV
jgi:flagellar FliJ protein